MELVINSNGGKKIVNLELTTGGVNLANTLNNMKNKSKIYDYCKQRAGTYYWLPKGLKVMSAIEDWLNSELSKMGAVNFETPHLISSELLSKERIFADHFENECFRVGLKHYLKPTAELLIYDYMQKKIKSYKQLPLLVFQKSVTFRREVNCTPFIRAAQIAHFHETHGFYKNPTDALQGIEAAKRIYTALFKMLRIPCIVVKRPKNDTFPGADFTIAYDTIICGRRLQIGTIHYLATNYHGISKLMYRDKNGLQKPVYQICYGISERILLAQYYFNSYGDFWHIPDEINRELVISDCDKSKTMAILGQHGIPQYANKIRYIDKYTSKALEDFRIKNLGYLGYKYAIITRANGNSEIIKLFNSSKIDILPKINFKSENGNKPAYSKELKKINLDGQNVLYGHDGTHTYWGPSH